MRIKKLQLKQFKRFEDITINLGDDPRKIIALVGPNGCGKSSIFDAFEEKQKDYKRASNSRAADFFSNLFYSIIPGKKSERYDKNESIKIEGKDGQNFDRKSFYIRSAYRFTPQLRITNIKSLPDVIEDMGRPTSSVDVDSRLQENYERLLGKAYEEYQHGTRSGPEMRKELVGRINEILARILDVKISGLGDVTAGKGQLYFEKGNSKDFPYENLSSGEKEVVDIIVDLIVKTPDFNNTVYCIDEPELHLNTSIQRKLLVEINKLIPETCQLWVATHSVGFLRALQEDLKDKCSILDFSREDYFNVPSQIFPMITTRKNWQRIFQTALEDLTGLLAPKKIFYCEGRPDPTAANGEQGIDADIYNEIFSEEKPDTLFVSSGGNNQVNKNAALALKIIGKAFMDTELYLLKDRDALTDQERAAFVNGDTINRMLTRREIENYVFDKEVLKKFCQSKGTQFDETRFNGKVSDIALQDLKPVQQEIQASCNASGGLSDFKRELAKVISKDMQIYKELAAVIFQQ